LHAATANAASECSALVNFSKSWLRCRTDARSGRLRYPKLRCDIYCVIRDTMQSMDESRLPGESCVSALTEKGIARNCEMRCPFYFPREEFHGDKMARPDIEQVPRYISKIETSPWRGAYRIRQKWHKDAYVHKLLSHKSHHYVSPLKFHRCPGVSRLQPRFTFACCVRL